MIHELKSWPHLFDATVSGGKVHELRRNDRPYAVGDVLRLREYNPKTGEYTGRSADFLVTYLTSPNNPCALSDEALSPEFCILSLASKT